MVQGFYPRFLHISSRLFFITSRASSIGNCYLRFTKMMCRSENRTVTYLCACHKIWNKMAKRHWLSCWFSLKRALQRRDRKSSCHVETVWSLKWYTFRKKTPLMHLLHQATAGSLGSFVRTDRGAPKLGGRVACRGISHMFWDVLIIDLQFIQFIHTMSRSQAESCVRLCWHMFTIVSS